MKKKVMFLLGCTVSLMLTTSSCRSSKPTTTDDDNIEVKDADNCAALAAEPSNNVRAFGIGTSPNRMAAYNMALEQGRANLAKILASKVDNEFKKAETTDESATEQSSKHFFEGKTFIILENTCKQTVQNSREICSKTYKKKTKNLYEVHVCLELSSTSKNEVKQQIDKLLNK